MHTISVVGAKGGTAKSATAHALAHVLAASGLDITIVDADPQGSLTRRLGLNRAADPLTTDPATVDLERVPAATGRILLVPGGRALEGAGEPEVRAHFRRAVALGGDLVLVDTPPALGPLVRSAMAVSDLVLIPCAPGAESLDGVADMRAAAEDVHPGVLVRAFVVLAHRRSRILRWTQSTADLAFPGVLYRDLVVPYEVAAAEAGTLRLPVTASAPKSRAAAAYRTLAVRLATDLGLSLTITDAED